MTIPLNIDTNFDELPDARVHYWNFTASGDLLGDPLKLPDFPDKTVTCTGTFNGHAVTMQGSSDNSTWVTLIDMDGTSAIFTAGTVAYTLKTNLPYIRPSLDVSTGVTLKVSATSAK